VSLTEKVRIWEFEGRHQDIADMGQPTEASSVPNALSTIEDSPRGGSTIFIFNTWSPIEGLHLQDFLGISHSRVIHVK
jgi:hypothetical protein